MNFKLVPANPAYPVAESYTLGEAAVEIAFDETPDAAAVIDRLAATPVGVSVVEAGGSVWTRLPD